ncbi:hypothetical protein HNR67_002654 [Crossiella cryophila]|uniref:Uncharacterized protein n=1 Tax=Crossiella cryophila TaxID=43355 RepID=A0A7W7FRZ4_9PSEU|nr:hypothetical protein [Crossiella cryophila]
MTLACRCPNNAVAVAEQASDTGRTPSAACPTNLLSARTATVPVRTTNDATTTAANSATAKGYCIGDRPRCCRTRSGSVAARRAARAEPSLGLSEDPGRPSARGRACQCGMEPCAPCPASGGSAGVRLLRPPPVTRSCLHASSSRSAAWGAGVHRDVGAAVGFRVIRVARRMAAAAKAGSRFAPRRTTPPTRSGLFTSTPTLRQQRGEVPLGVHRVRVDQEQPGDLSGPSAGVGPVRGHDVRHPGPFTHTRPASRRRRADGSAVTRENGSAPGGAFWSVLAATPSSHGPREVRDSAKKRG